MNCRSVLIVDDESDARDLVSFFLRETGFEVGEATSGTDALEVLKRRAYDLVVCDVRMPGIDGIELVPRVHALSPKTEVILLSAFADWDMYFDAKHAGAFDVLMKPFKLEELLRTISGALELRAMK